MNIHAHRLYAVSPAGHWVEAYPIGCGRLGAMIFGRPGQEKLCLNEDTLWSGVPGYKTVDSFYENYLKTRSLLDEKRYADANDFASSCMNNSDSACYQPAGDLHLDFALSCDEEKYRNYRRILDFQNACCTTEFILEGAEKRTCFASFPDSVLVLRIQSERERSCRIYFTSSMEGESGASGRTVLFDGFMPYFNRYGKIIEKSGAGERGLHYCMACRVIACDGKVLEEKEEGGRASLSLQNFKDCVLVVAIRSNFKDYKTKPSESRVDPFRLVEQDLASAEEKGYECLLERHIKDHQRLYERSVLDFPEIENDKLPTVQRIKLCQENQDPDGKNCRSLAALLYHYGRYLTIASSRTGTQPTNLQGIWNNMKEPPWGCNYTTNINLEMNYWQVESADLPECGEPLFRMIQELSENGRMAAKDLYHADGWCTHHNSDIWRFCSPATGWCGYSLWPMAGAWMCRHLMEHFRYNPEDVEFLKEVYPILCGSAEFLLSILRVRREDGLMDTCPSSSPENCFFDPV